MAIRGAGLARRVVVEGLGWILVLGGAAALILPGPGLLAIFAGLVLLSQQYQWAERRLAPVKYRALKGAADSVATFPRILVSLLGVAFLVACGVLWILSPAEPSWWPVADRWWLVGGVGTGATLIGSAVAAAALVVYSFRRFHGNPDAVAALDAEIDSGVQTR